MTLLNRPLAVLVVAMPIAAHAQARNGNVYDGTAHQPSAGVVGQEQRAGVAPAPAQADAENHDLSRMNTALLQKAQHDAQQAPAGADNPYGVQPGGAVKISPGSDAR